MCLWSLQHLFGFRKPYISLKKGGEPPNVGNCFAPTRLETDERGALDASILTSLTICQSPCVFNYFSNTFSVFQPRLTLVSKVFCLIPNKFAHCAIVIFLLLNSIQWFFVVLLACSVYVSHLQFSRQYPLFPSNLPRVLLVGASPMSA